MATATLVNITGDFAPSVSTYLNKRHPKGGFTVTAAPDGVSVSFWTSIKRPLAMSLHQAGYRYYFAQPDAMQAGLGYLVITSQERRS